jgi:hypothetical protein
MIDEAVGMIRVARPSPVPGSFFWLAAELQRNFAADAGM